MAASLTEEGAGPRLGGRGDGEGWKRRAFHLARWVRAEVELVDNRSREWGRSRYAFPAGSKAPRTERKS